MGGKYKDLDKQKRTWFRNHLRRRYGITVEDFEHMLALQGGVCAICKCPEKVEYKRTLSVDHDHITGKVRGLLCHRCNTALGKLEDNPFYFDAAATYIRQHLGSF